MPAAVEVADGAGQIGIVEVQRQLIAQHPGNARGDQHEGLPLDIELDAEAEGAQPGQGRGQGGEADLHQLVPEDRQLVRNEDLHGEAQDKALQPGLQLLQAGLGLVQLCPQLAVAGDGAREELGEEEGEIGESHRVIFGDELPPADVHQIGDEGEGVEADAHGLDPHQLEGSQGQDVDGNGGGSGGLAEGGPLNAEAQHKVHHGKEQGPERVDDGVDGNEDHAAQEQQIAAILRRAEPVERQKGRQEP